LRYILASNAPLKGGKPPSGGHIGGQGGRPPIGGRVQRSGFGPMSPCHNPSPT